MTERQREEEALFRLSVLGPVAHAKLRRGELHSKLREFGKQAYVGPDGLPRKIRWKTIEGWLYLYRHGGFLALLPRPRSDRGTVRALDEPIVELVLDMKREDPGRSAPMIIRELELAGRIAPNSVSLSTVGRILRRAGLSGPRLELEHPARYRWVVSCVNELWQSDALHGPKLIDPETGRIRKSIIFGLLDDRSRTGVRVWAGFCETEEAFLDLLYEAMLRRGIPYALLVDLHGSFCGHGLRLVCAQLGIRLIHTRPKDGPGKGAIERFWRTLRASVLDRLDPEKVKTIDDLNTRLTAWCEAEYNHRPHAGLQGRTPMEVWQEGAGSIRWVEDGGALAALFVGTVTRKALNDSTISFRGIVYEVPPHLRRRKVEVRYSLLDADRVWIVDGGVEVALRPVDLEGNATRSRHGGKPSESPKPKTGMNAVELLLDQVCGRGPKEADHA